MSDLPRLLFCCFDVVPGPSAISRRLTEYIKGLSERFQVVVLSAKTPDHPHIERYHGARLLRVPVGSGDLPARSQTFDRAVRRQLESEEYGLVHFFDPFAGYALCERRSELGYRLVYDACTFPSVELPLEHPSLASNRRFVARVRRQELFCLMNADGVVVGSPLTADYVAGLGVERAQVRVLRAPVALEPFTPEVMGKPDATPMKVLHLGRITLGQGLELLLEALQLALQTVDIRLTLVGPRNAEAQGRLEARVGELKLTGKVEFQEPVHHDDIHKVLATADVGSLALDDNERNRVVGTPLARLGEYLAAGRPVIAADLPSVRALMPADGVVLYRPGDPRALADALVQLATDTARRVKLGAAARAAAAEWDSARVRLELVKLYADVTGAKVEARPDAAADPFEPTQMGASPADDTGEVTQSGARGRGGEDSNVGTNKVKTDPAIASQSDSSTDANAKADRPPIMGVPLRDESPALDAAMQAVTEPGARPASEPPVVMGAPLREADEGPATAAKVAAALSEAVPGPLPTSSAPPPVDEAPLASFDDDVRTDLRAPAEVVFPPAPVPSVPTAPDGVDAAPPGVARLAPGDDEPFVLPTGAEIRARPGPPIAEPIPAGSVAPFLPPPPGVAAPRAPSPELTPTAAAGPALAEAPSRGPTTIRVAAVPPEVAASTPSAAAPVVVPPLVPPLTETRPAEAPPAIPLLEVPPPVTPAAPTRPAAASPTTPLGAATRPSSTALPAMTAAPATASPATPTDAAPRPSATALPTMAHAPAAGSPATPTDAATHPSSTALSAMAAAPTASPATPTDAAPRPNSTALPAMSAPPTAAESPATPMGAATRPSSTALPAMPAAAESPPGRPSSTALPAMPAAPSGAESPVTPMSAATRPSSTALPAMPAAAESPPRRPSSTAVPAMAPAPTAAASSPPRSSSTAMPAMTAAPTAAESPARRPSSTALPAMAVAAPASAAGATAPSVVTAGAESRATRPSSTAIPAQAPAAVPSLSPRTTSSTTLPAMTAATPRPAASAPTPATAPKPVVAAPGAASSARASTTGLPAAGAPPPLTARPSASSVDTADDEVAEIDADEVMDVDEPSESVEEIMDADEAVQTVDTDPSPPPSALDPWLAQLVHGYCPPESHLFDRHTPPTTMPGRDT